MIFNPQDLIKKEGSFVFSGDVKANAHSCLNKSIIKEFWKNFTFQCSVIDVTESGEFIFTVGSAEKLVLDEYDYSINIISTYTAALLRKVMPIDGDYAKAGWAEFDVGCRW